jgi:hypothetical protein
VRTDSFRDYVLEQLATTGHAHAPLHHLRHQAMAYTKSFKQVLRNYREVPTDIPEDAEQLTAKARRS